MRVYDTEYIKFPLMVGIHQISAFRGKMFGAVSSGLYKGISHGRSDHMSSDGISVLFRIPVRMLFYIYKSEKIINDEW